MDSQSDASRHPQDSPADFLPPSRALVPAPVGAAPDQRARLVRQRRRDQRAGARRHPGQRSATPPTAIAAWPRPTTPAGPTAPPCALVRLVRPPRAAAAARLRPGRGRLPGRRARAETLAGDDQAAPGGDPLPAPRRRLPGADRRRLRLRDPGRHPPRGRQERPGPPQEGGCHGDRSCAGCWRRSRTICVGCGTGRCCWSASPARCGARSWRRSASSSWREPIAESGSPCRRPKASRPTR